MTDSAERPNPHAHGCAAIVRAADGIAALGTQAGGLGELLEEPRGDHFGVHQVIANALVSETGMQVAHGPMRLSAIHGFRAARLTSLSATPRRRRANAWRWRSSGG